MYDFLWRPFLFILLPWTALVCESKIFGDHEYPALFFTRSSTGIITLDKKSLEELKSKNIFTETATACPAKSDEEIEFNMEYSLSKNSVYVQKTYEETQITADLEYYACDSSYKIAVVYHTKDVEFNFGFEIYFDKIQFKDTKFKESIRSDYDSILNTHLVRNYVKPVINYVAGLPILSYITLLPGVSNIITPQTKSYLGPNHNKIELGFIWIDTMKTKYNFKLNRFIQSTYNIPYISGSLGHQHCDNYDLGKEYFRDIDVDKLYEEDNQKRMLQGVRIPTLESNNEHEGEAACEFENQCFTKWLSIPADIFNFQAGSTVSCSHLVTAPIWKSTIEYVLKKLDNFLYTLLRVEELANQRGTVAISSNIYGTLELPIDSDGKKSTKKITLGEKDMPVPDIIYKIPKYDLRYQNHYKDENDNVYRIENGVTSLIMIVVIHNNPFFNPETDKICEDKCLDWGFQEIQYKNTDQGKFKSKYIYCCPANDDNVRTKLGLQLNKKVTTKTETKELNLKSFPVYESETVGYRSQDIHELVNKKYQELFEGVTHEPNMDDENIKMEDLEVEQPENDDEDARVEFLEDEEKKETLLNRKSIPVKDEKETEVDPDKSKME